MALAGLDTSRGDQPPWAGAVKVQRVALTLRGLVPGVVWLFSMLV